MVDDIVVGFEDTVREPVVADELPYVLDGVQFGRSRRQWDEGDVAWDFECLREVPACLIDDDDGMSARCHDSGDFLEMEGHGLGISPGKHVRGADAARGTNGTVRVPPS